LELVEGNTISSHSSPSPSWVELIISREIMGGGWESPSPKDVFTPIGFGEGVHLTDLNPTAQ